MAGRRRILSALFAAIFALVLGGTAWCFATRDEPRIDAMNTNAAGSAARAIDASTATASGDPEENATSAARTAERVAAPLQLLRVRLRGLHPDAPWTTPLRLDLGAQGATQEFLKHAAEATVDAEGLATFALPSWWSTAAVFRVGVEADDERYQSFYRRLPTAIDPSVEASIDVVAMGLLEGRVVDSASQGVPRARISVFDVQGTVPVDRESVNCECDAAGVFRVLVPLEAPVCIVARDAEGHDRLPASTRVLARGREPTRVADLRLADGVRAHGTLRWEDGAPIAGATLRLRASGTELHAGGDWGSEGSGTPIEVDDGRVRSASARTLENGSFVFTLPDTDPVVVKVSRLYGSRLCGTFEQTLRAGTEAVLTLPRPVTLQPTQEGAPCTAQFEFDDRQPGETERHPGSVVMLARRVAVRAVEKSLCSAWTDLDPSHAGTTVALELAQQRTEVSLAIDRVEEVKLVRTECTDERGRHSAQRWNRRDPIALHLEPGRWQLAIEVWCGPPEWAQQPLVVDRTIDVGTAPLRLEVPLERGGTFTVTASGRVGRFASGTFRVLDATGRDRSAAFTVHWISERPSHSAAALWSRRVGELVPRGTNEFGGVLREGTYDLLFDFVGYGKHRERVTIRAGETTEVKLRLEP